MGFDVNKFQNTQYIQRTEDVTVDVLKAFFGPKDKPVFKVRNLTGEELGRVNQAIQTHRKTAAILDGLLSNVNKEQVEAIKKSIGSSDSVPDDIARRIEMLILGGVEPKIDLTLAKKLCRCFPIEFYELTNTITRLTGLGSELGKVKPSGKTKK